jgi:hypothetical protein
MTINRHSFYFRGVPTTDLPTFCAPKFKEVGADATVTAGIPFPVVKI